MTKKNFLQFYDKYGSFLIFLIVFLYFTATQGKTFMNGANLINILRSVAVYGICVTGIAMLMISGGMDMSVGGQIASNGMFLAMMLTMWKLPVGLCILLAMLTGVLIGCFNGFISAYFKLQPIVVTLCTMLIMNGLAMIVTNGYAIYDMPAPFLWVGQGYIWKLPVSVYILVLVAVIGCFIMNKTYLGRKIYALGGNEEAARLAGIHVTRLRIVVFAMSSFFVSIATIVMVSRTNSATATAGSNYQFDCLTAASLGGIMLGGGKGNILQAYLGVLTIGVLNTGLVIAGANTNLQTVFKGVLLMATLIIGAIQKSSLMESK